MRVVRPKSRDEFDRIVKEALKRGEYVYIAAYPCPECEIFEAALEELRVNTEKIVKIDVPDEEWAVEYVLDELGVPGSPSVITPDGRIIDDPDPVVMAKKMKELLG